MNIIDIIILIIIIIFAIRGWRRGFIYELFGIAIIIAGFIFALIFYKPIAGILNQYLKNKDLSLVVSFIAIFVGTALTLIVIRNILEDLIENLNISDVDGILGMVFSVLKIIIIVAFILLLVDRYSIFDLDKIISRSFFFPIIRRVFFAVIGILPEGFKNLILGVL